MRHLDSPLLFTLSRSISQCGIFDGFYLFSTHQWATRYSRIFCRDAKTFNFGFSLTCFCVRFLIENIHMCFACVHPCMYTCIQCVHAIYIDVNIAPFWPPEIVGKTNERAAVIRYRGGGRGGDERQTRLEIVAPLSMNLTSFTPKITEKFNYPQFGIKLYCTLNKTPPAARKYRVCFVFKILL